MTLDTPSSSTPETHLVEAKDSGNPIARAIVGAVVAGLSAVIVALENGHGIEAAEWIAIAITTLVTLSVVWAVPTLRTVLGGQGKAITAAVLTALGVLGTGLADDGSLSSTEWLTALTALLSALLVSQTPETVHDAPGLPSSGSTGPAAPTVR
jgi:hypothetical protein